MRTGQKLSYLKQIVVETNIDFSFIVPLQDMWTSSYLSPVLDHSQDLSDKEGFVEDGVVTIRFSRSVQHKFRRKSLLCSSGF